MHGYIVRDLTRSLSVKNSSNASETNPSASSNESNTWNFSLRRNSWKNLSTGFNSGEYAGNFDNSNNGFSSSNQCAPAPSTIINVLCFSNLLRSAAKMLKHTLSSRGKNIVNISPSLLWLKCTNTNIRTQCAGVLVGALRSERIFCLIRCASPTASHPQTPHLRRRKVCSPDQSFLYSVAAVSSFFAFAGRAVFSLIGSRWNSLHTQLIMDP